MHQPFFTIGHSTRSLEEFIGLLEPNAIGTVVDVRTVPRSRTNPQYNGETFPAALAKQGIAYEHIAALGGLRGRSRDVPEPARMTPEARPGPDGSLAYPAKQRGLI